MLASGKHLVDIVAVALDAGGVVFRDAAQLGADHDAGQHVGFLFQNVQNLKKNFVGLLVGNHGLDAGARISRERGLRNDNPIPGSDEGQIFIQLILPFLLCRIGVLAAAEQADEAY